MKWVTYALFLVALALGQSSSACATVPVRPSWATSDKIVAAYYFYWYDIYSGLHFIDSDGSDALTDHPPDAYLSNFSYTEVAWHRRELLDMLAAQIDVVLPVYWGNTANFFWSQAGLEKLVLAEQGLIADGYAPPKIGMFYDTTALRDQNGGVPPDLTTPDGQALFYGMLADFFHLVPQSLWATIDGRPIVFLYSAEYVSSYDQSTFAYALQYFQTEFGTTPYIVREGSWVGVNTDGVYAWGVALNGPAVYGNIGSVGPGYDETAVYGRPNPKVRDRECGDFYEMGWEALANSSARLVAIETWNEFHEGTDISASREYDRAYIDATARHIQRWRLSNYSQGATIWLDLGQYPYLQGLRPAFNHADGAWLVDFVSQREAVHPDHTTDPSSYYVYLEVHDDFIKAAPTEVWVTVEYYDGGYDQWMLEYDGVADPYTDTPLVQLQNTGQWRFHTFHLSDAYFAGRQNEGADLRLSDLYWADGMTNYFGRVWISKSAPANQPPALDGPRQVLAIAGQVTEIPLSTVDPEGHALTLSLERGVSFASLTDNGDGAGVLRLAPTEADLRACPYWVRLLVNDAGVPPLADAVAFRVVAGQSTVLLPLASR